MEKDKKMLNIAKKGAQERWHPTIPKATHSGILNIGGQEIQCDVLNDGSRVLRQKTFLKTMGRGKIGGAQRKGAEDTNLPVFLTANNLIPYLEPKIVEGCTPIQYRGADGRRLIGYKATILPDVCKVYAKADDDGVFENHIGQKKIAQTCRAMLYGLAEVGVIALVDDATGYVYERERNELQKILENYIAKELMPWTKTFDDVFFEQVYRLHNWQWPKMNKNHPQYLGQFINKYVYGALPEVVLDELKQINPANEKGVRKHRHHQLLTQEVGHKTLMKQLSKVTTLMKISNNMEQFKEFVEKVG